MAFCSRDTPASHLTGAYTCLLPRRSIRGKAPFSWRVAPPAALDAPEGLLSRLLYQSYCAAYVTASSLCACTWAEASHLQADSETEVLPHVTCHGEKHPNKPSRRLRCWFILDQGFNFAARRVFLWLCLCLAAPLHFPPSANSSSPIHLQ